MSDLRAELNGILARHSTDCDRIVQAARKAGIPVGYGACGNGGIPTFQAIVQRCVLAMDAHAELRAQAEKLAGLLRECQTADCNSRFPLKLDHNKIDAALAAFDASKGTK